MKNLGKSQKIIPGVTEWELKNLKINKHIILILFLLLIPNMLLETANTPSPDGLLAELKSNIKVSYQKRFFKGFKRFLIVKMFLFIMSF